MNFLGLATDYDGTIAHHGVVEPATVQALCAVRESGRKVILVTGREMHDLMNVFTETEIFDRIVAENGAVLYNPMTKEERLLAPTPPAVFADALREAGVASLSVGRVIVATQEVYLGVVQEAIGQCNYDLQIILNKGSLMILPAGTNKATGLRAACKELRLQTASVAAIGDAENDIDFFKVCGWSVAVANALPEVKARVNMVTRGDHGTGVREFIEVMLQEKLALESRHSSGS
jgi:HAD superfamily hydrolase (TIGR01484 family)